MKKTIALVLSLVMLFTAFPSMVSASQAGVKDLLNSAKLSPMQTGYPSLDQQVKKLLSEKTNSKMTTYEKVLALYDYCSKTFDYNIPVMFYDDELYSSYLSPYDAMVIEDARYILETGTGVCDNFAALFMVLTRAIGLESYFVGGTVKNGSSYTGHAWTVIRLGGAYYIFDTQVENKYYKKDGKMRYSWFGNAVASSTGYDSSMMNEYISDFGNFEQVNLYVQNTQSDPDLPLLPGEDISFHVVSVESNIEVGDFYYICKYGELNMNALDSMSESELTANHGKDFTFTPTKSGIWTLFVLIDTEIGLLVSVDHYRVLGENEYTLMLGDIDIDGKITTADARHALRAAVKIITVSEDEPTYWLFDVNFDGAVTAEDARRILRAAVNLESLPELP